MGLMLPKPVMTSMNDRDGNQVFRVGSACVNGYRENMEDAHIAFLKPDWGFFGVFDGHVNDHCSQYLEKKWTQVLGDGNFTVPITDERMKQLCLEIDKDYIDNGGNGGSTATFFLARKVGDKMQLQVGNVGDSRVLVSQGGKCVPMTEDHKPTNPEETARIVRCNGFVENARVGGSLALSRAFGDVDYKKNEGFGQLDQQVIPLPDVTNIEFGWNTGDYALLACDGVFEGQFSNEEVIEFANAQLKTEKDLAVVSFRVCEEAIRRGSKDNISCMIVQFQDGSDYGNLPQHSEFVPGPVSAPNHSGFMKAYTNMAAKAGFTMGKTLELRYDTLVKLVDAGDEEAKEEFSKLYSGMCPENLTGEARTSWFENQAEAKRAQPDEDMGTGPAAVYQQLQQRGIPISSFLSAMRSMDNDDGP